MQLSFPLASPAPQCHSLRGCCALFAQLSGLGGDSTDTKCLSPPSSSSSSSPLLWWWPSCDPQHPSWSLNHGTVPAKGAQPDSPSPRCLSLASPLAGGSVSRLINARHGAPTAPGVQPPPAGKSSLAARPGKQGECGRVMCVGTLMFIQVCTGPYRPTPVREVPWAPCRLLRAHCNPTGISHPKLG